MISIKTQQKEELKKLQAIVELDVDKRAHFDLQHNYSLLNDKNRTLMTEVMHLRRANDQKDAQVENLERRLATAEKQITMIRI